MSFTCKCYSNSCQNKLENMQYEDICTVVEAYDIYRFCSKECMQKEVASW